MSCGDTPPSEGWLDCLSGPAAGSAAPPARSGSTAPPRLPNLCMETVTFVSCLSVYILQHSNTWPTQI